jgi:hypothetical protein
VHVLARGKGKDVIDGLVEKFRAKFGHFLKLKENASEW